MLTTCTGSHLVRWTVELGRGRLQPLRRFGRLMFFGLWVVACGWGSPAVGWADIFAIGQFSNTIERFDADTGAQSTFANLGAFEGGFVAPSSIVFNNTTKQFVVAGFNSGKLYTVDARTGTVLGSHATGILDGPSGMVYDGNGNLYVSNLNSASISVLDSGFNLINTINMPNFGTAEDPIVPIPSGMAFDGNGQLLINTFSFAGIVSYDTGSGTFGSFAGAPAALAQMAIGQDGTIYSGTATFSNDVFVFDSAGNPLNNITIGEDLLPKPDQSFTSADTTNPAGVAIADNGDLIVAALGRTNPFSDTDNFQSNGGLFRFAADGTLLRTYAVQTTPFSGVTFVSASAIPEPGSGVVIGLGILGWSLLRRQRRR
jgi:sugar lactone lactonase YvrE